MKIIPIYRVVFFGQILACFLLSGCGKDNLSISDMREWFLACPLLSGGHTDDPVLARAGDVVIRVSDYQSYMQRLRLGRSLSSATPAERRSYLEQILYRKMMARLARTSGVQMDPANRQVIDDMEYSYLFAAFVKQVSVTDQEMSDYYQHHGNEFNMQEICVSHVPIKSTAQVSKFKALLVKEKPVAGMKKDKMSRPFNQGKPADINFFNAISVLKPGQIVGPLRTPWGYELVRKEPLPAPPLSAVKEQVRQRLQAEKLAQLYSDAMSKTKLVVDEKLLSSLDLTQK